LKAEPKWMQTAFEIALHTGCRLRETRLPLSRIDFAEKKITFPSHPKAVRIGRSPCRRRRPFARCLNAFASRTELHFDFPFQPSRRLQQFFIKVNMLHLFFHCLRVVTYVNRLRRAGVPREAAMRLVNHSSDFVHQIYQQERVADVEKWRDAVQFPA
jgi:hypothetical protein